MTTPNLIHSKDADKLRRIGETFPELMSQEDIDREYHRAQNIITVCKLMEGLILIVAIGAMSLFAAHTILMLLTGSV